jgi:hypothetical protein
VELFIFGRFHARPGDENAVEEALRNVVAPARGSRLPEHSRVPLRARFAAFLHSLALGK